MTTEERKAWERAQKENRIIDIAQEILFEQGYENTTILQIAEAVGYNKRTLYLYFRDKEEIFLGVVLRGLTLLHDMLKQTVNDAQQDKKGLRALGETFFRFSLEHPEYLKLIMLFESNNCIYYKDASVDEDRGRFQQACQAKTDAIADLMTGSIQRAIDEGRVKTELTPVQLMLILWGQVFGVMQIILMRKDHFEDAFGISYTQLFQSFLDTVESGIM